MVLACLNSWRAQAVVQYATAVLLAGAVLLAMVGLLAMATPPAKLLIPVNVYAQLAPLGATTGLAGVDLSPNELGGVLACFVPLAAVVSVCRGEARTRTLAIVSTPLLVGALLLTQSRGALLAVASSLLVGIVWQGGKRVVPWVVGLLVLGSAPGWAALARDDLGQPVLTSAVASLGGRAELWRRGLSMLLDMPATGIGLNAFPVVLVQHYPTVDELDPSVMQHAHNVYLQTALDLGLPGLAGVLALGRLAVIRGLAAAHRGPQRPLAIGLLLGLLAYALHGLVEAVGVNARTSPVVWVVLGLLIALAARPEDRWQSAPQPSLVARLRCRRAVCLPLLLLVGLLLATPLALNSAVLLLHRGDAAAIANPLLTADLDLAERLAWGPFPARVWSARALAAGSRGDVSSQVANLELAATAAPWDPTLALRLAEINLARGDADGAVRAWQIGRLIEAPLARGQVSSPATALGWFTLAHRVDPSDWRPFLAAAVKLTEAGHSDEATAMLHEALRLGGAQAYRSAVTEGLFDESVPLLASIFLIGPD